MSSLVDDYASQPFNKRSDLTGDAQLKQSAHVHLAVAKSQKLRGWLDSRGAPLPLYSIHAFHEHLVYT